MSDEELVERVARELYYAEWDKPSDLPWQFLGDEERVAWKKTARAITPIVQAETLNLVERHLSACAYDPAPYTAMKYRLTAIRNQDQTDER